MNMKRGKIDYRCSFCGKAQDAVHRLIAGPGGVYICDECINLCREIIEEEQVMRARPVPGDAQGAHWVGASGRAHTKAVAPPPPQPSMGARGPESMETASVASAHDGDEDLPAHLAPLVAELAAARTALERLASENGALRERLRLHGRETD